MWKEQFEEGRKKERWGGEWISLMCANGVGSSEEDTVLYKGTTDCCHCCCIHEANLRRVSKCVVSERVATVETSFRFRPSKMDVCPSQSSYFFFLLPSPTIPTFDIDFYFLMFNCLYIFIYTWYFLFLFLLLFSLFIFTNRRSNLVSYWCTHCKKRR
jgi:hypothetical protein